MSIFYFKKLLFSFAVSLILISTCSVSFAECEGTYFKTTTKKLLTDKVVFLDYSWEHFQDLTGDGKIDAVGFGYNRTTGDFRQIYILPGDGAGDFGEPIRVRLPYAVEPYRENLQITDFNSDGKNDLAVTFNVNPKISIVYRNDGNGIFTALNPIVLSNGESLRGFADINGDGLVDLLSDFYTTPATSFYRLANSDGTFGSRISLPGNRYRLGDFNMDGRLDFAVLYRANDSYYLHFYYNQGNGAYTFGNVSLFLSNGDTSIRAVKDFNNDGRPDLFFNAGNKMVIVINQGNNNFTRTEYAIGDQNSLIQSTDGDSTIDFNGDGFQDILYFDVDLPKYFVFINNGAGEFVRHDYNRHLPGNAIGDFDGDNKTDLLRVVNFNRTNGHPEPFQETQITVIKNICTPFGQTKIVDFDGDGKSGFALWRESDGRWSYNFPFPPYMITYNWGMTGDIPTPGDFDGDGKSDISVFRPSNGVWYIRNSSDNSFLAVQFGASEDKPVASDYNGDGRTDIAVYRPSNGTWYVLASGTSELSAEHFGDIADKPVPDDYDGDGKTDFAVFRPSTGIWYYRKSSDGNSVGIQWGYGTDTPVRGDYDGDGKADLTVIRGGTLSYWYILRSSDQKYSAFAFGTSGDIPQTGDYDGDGLLELRAYRPSTFTWHIAFLSSPPYSFGSTGEIPVSSLNNSY